MTKVALIIGSAPDAVQARAIDAGRLSGIFAINNAWRVRDDWTHLIHAGDFPDDRKPLPEPHRVMVSHEAYVPSNNRFGGIVYAGGTMLFSASYWILDIFRPDVMAYCGCDMIYAHPGRSQHFYGNGRPDPLRPDPTLQSLEAKANRLMLLALRQGCLCVNLSSLPSSRLTFPRWSAECLSQDIADLRKADLADLLCRHDTNVVARALDLEANLGFFLPTGDYWNYPDRIDPTGLSAIDRLWLNAFPTADEADNRAIEAR